MIGVPGTAHRLFGALREEGISVILISQGSSEHSICCAIPQEQAERAAHVTRRAFERELVEGQIQSVDVDLDLAILAVVGDGMAGTPGVAGQGVRRARHLRGQRARHRPGRLRAQHLRGGRRPQRHARAARGACGPLPLAAYAVDRRHRTGHASDSVFLAQLAAQSARLREAVQPRPAACAACSARGACCSRSPGSMLAELARPARRRAAAPADLAAFRRARARGLPAAHGADRLHRQRGRRGAATPTGWRRASTS